MYTPLYSLPQYCFVDARGMLYECLVTVRYIAPITFFFHLFIVYILSLKYFIFSLHMSCSDMPNSVVYTNFYCIHNTMPDTNNDN